MTAQQYSLPGPPNRPSESSTGGGNAIRCACGAHWFGLKTCHCSACHQTFTAIAAFDKHRAGSHANDTRHCIDPQSAGLVDAGRNYQCWMIHRLDKHPKAQP